MGKEPFLTEKLFGAGAMFRDCLRPQRYTLGLHPKCSHHLNFCLATAKEYKCLSSRKAISGPWGYSSLGTGFWWASSDSSLMPSPVWWGSSEQLVDHQIYHPNLLLSANLLEVHFAPSSMSLTKMLTNITYYKFYRNPKKEKFSGSREHQQALPALRASPWPLLSQPSTTPQFCQSMPQ